MPRPKERQALVVTNYESEISEYVRIANTVYILNAYFGCMMPVPVHGSYVAPLAPSATRQLMP